MREADAEDVTQEVFRRLAKALPKFELDQSIGTFRNCLFTVTRSKLNNHLVKLCKLPVPTEHVPEQRQSTNLFPDKTVLLEIGPGSETVISDSEFYTFQSITLKMRGDSRRFAIAGS